MAKTIGKGLKWVDDMVDVLNEFVDDEVEIIDSTFRETANETAELVRSLSPGKGDYASGWEMIEQTHGALDESISFRVANPKHYQLTHLLEKGHAVKNQFGDPEKPGAKKRVRARKHIKIAETWGNEVLIMRLRSRL